MALACGIVPTPLMDTFVALLLARTVIAGTACGLFDVLEPGPLEARESRSNARRIHMQPSDCCAR